MAVVARRGNHGNTPEWLPLTFNLLYELPKFVRDYLERKERFVVVDVVVIIIMLLLLSTLLQPPVAGRKTTCGSLSRGIWGVVLEFTSPTTS